MVTPFEVALCKSLMFEEELWKSDYWLTIKLLGRNQKNGHGFCLNFIMFRLRNDICDMRRARIHKTSKSNTSSEDFISCEYDKSFLNLSSERRCKWYDELFPRKLSWAMIT